MNRIGFAARVASAALFGAALLLASMVTQAQSAASYDPPKLSDGTPDFRGIWQARSLAYLDLEGRRPAGNVKTVTKSAIVDPPDGKIPYLPQALKQRDANFKNRAAVDPANNCYQAGIPRAVLLPTPFQIVESPGNLAIVYTDNHAYRIVDPSGVPHDDGIDFFMGDSRGHWEGNTLVVETTNFTDKDAIGSNGAGYPGDPGYHSDQLKVIEKFTRTGPKTLNYTATVDDPKTWVKPWTILIQLDRNDNYQLLEYACHEGNYAMTDILSGARDADGANKAPR
jgi:hypothetical protein